MHTKNRGLPSSPNSRTQIAEVRHPNRGFHRGNILRPTQKPCRVTKKLSSAIMNEDYELAAKIKTQLEDLQQKNSHISAPAGTIRGPGSPAPAPEAKQQQQYIREEPQYKASSDVSTLVGKGNTSPRQAPASPTAKGPATKENGKFVSDAGAGRHTTVQAMLEAGADPNSVDFQTGNSGLIAASETNHFDVVRLLVEAGANPNLRNRRGKTALHYTVENRYDKLTRYLVEEAGADVNIVDNTNKTPLQLAAPIPSLHQELQLMTHKKKKEEEENKANQPVSLGLVTVFLRTKGFPLEIGSTHNAADVTLAMSKLLNLQEIAKDLQIFEEAMGRERAMEDKEELLAVQDKWPNKNPNYFKFLIKVKRGSNSAAQMKFREVAYANK
ncbi:hypothetical protein PROFUN_00098 [Planoprotostelium fungivorum]|uniref:Ankyrin repeat domain-containing protein 54 n=1 Tax=Planoprotostelium fungivorum TaxID=1890364 RepID=A0A2P6P0M1_9EUKA|nr:hypothetical protein PROFUN_00098 [Planoprotostelium fungivorum]